MNKKKSGLFYGWWVVGACFFSTLYASGIVFFGFTAIFEPIAKEFNWSYTQVSIGASVRGLEAGLMAPVMGFLVDRFGPRPVMAAGGLVCAGGLMLMSQVNSLAMFYLAFFLVSVGMSACGATVLQAAVVNWFRRRVATASGIVASGFAMGGLLVPILSVAIDSLGWRTAMFIFGVGALVILPALSLLVRHKPEQYGYLPDGDIEEMLTSSELAVVRHSDDVDAGAREALTSRTFWYMALALMGQFLMVGAVVTHVMPYLSSVGIDRTTAAFVASAIPIASIGGRLGVGWFGNRFDKRKVCAVNFALMGLGLLLFGYVSADRMWLLVPFIIVLGVGWGSNVTMRVALLRELFGRTKFGTIHGVLAGIMEMGHIVGVSIPGWVYDSWGSYGSIWFIFAALSIAALFLMVSTPQFQSKARRSVEIAKEAA